MPILELDGESRELGPETTVGSGAQATWRIANRDLAARHFVVRLAADGGPTVAPTGAQQIVTRNGEPVPAGGAALASGDIVAAGSARFVYLAEASSPRPTLPSDEAAEAFLVDEDARTTYRLRRRTVTIGRDGASGIVVRDPTVSRHHADIKAEAAGHVIYSSGAAGTVINSRRVTVPYFLRDGDGLMVGGTTLTYAARPPAGTRVVDPAGGRDDTVARRETMVATRAVSDELDNALRRRPPIPLWIVVVLLILVAVVLYLVLLG